MEISRPLRSRREDAMEQPKEGIDLSVMKEGIDGKTDPPIRLFY